MINQSNNYPMKEWHFEHMQKTVVKYVAGLSETEKGFPWKVRQHKKYGCNLPNVRKNINFDIKHGVTGEEVVAFLDKVLNDPSFSGIRNTTDSKDRIKELQLI
jgi:hypothetical protein